jgi:hypothetical protein
MQNVKGYHAEWNLGCPGGWEYQRMAQERGKLCWNRINKIAGMGIELDFEHPVLNPVPLFMDMLLRAHRLRFQAEKLRRRNLSSCLSPKRTPWIKSPRISIWSSP